MAKRSKMEAYGGYGGTAECPGCYGKPVSSTLPECASCIFYASCQFYLKTAIDDDCRYSTRREKWRRHNSVSFDALGDTLETALKVDLAGPYEETLDTPEFTRREIMSILRTLLTDMDYSSMALAVYALHKHVSSNAELAKLLGCSRQNTHRRLIAAARGDERLKALLTATFFHFGRMARTGGQAGRGKGEKGKSGAGYSPGGVDCRKATGNRADFQKTDANGKMPTKGQRHAKNRVSDGFCRIEEKTTRC